MDCQKVQDAIVESLIEPPGTHTTAMIDVHIAGCPVCAAFADKQHTLDRTLSATLVPPISRVGLRAAVRTRARAEARTFWFDLLPDAIHFASCGVVTVLGLVWLPLSIPVVLAGAAVGTMLTHMLLMAAHDSLDAAEEITS